MGYILFIMVDILRKLFLPISFLIILLSLYYVYSTNILVSRADVSKSIFSLDNSYVFSTPLKAKADGLEKIRLTVFVLSNQGLGVPNKTVSFSDFQKLNVEAIQSTTDQYGKAVFDLSSNKAGDYYIQVLIEGQSLPQKNRISFY